MQDTKSGSGTNLGADGSKDGPSFSAGATTTIETKKGFSQKVEVIGNIDCSAPPSSCMDQNRGCRGVIPFTGDEADCDPNGIYTTVGEPVGATENETESCWDLSNYGGRVKASGIKSVFRNGDVAGLIAANPTLESACGDGAGPNGLQDGVVVCLEPLTENKCQVEEI